MLFSFMQIWYIMHPWEIYTNDWLNFCYSDMDLEKENKLAVTLKNLWRFVFNFLQDLWDKAFDKDIQIHLISRNKKFEVLPWAGWCSLEDLNRKPPTKGKQKKRICAASLIFALKLETM